MKPNSTNEKERSKAHSLYLRGLRRKKTFVTIARGAVLILFFSLWEFSARMGLIDPFIFSSPSHSLSVIWRMTADGSIWPHIGITVAETAIGFLAGTLLGIGIAVLLWYFPTAREIADPYLVVLNGLPKIALGPVIIVWVGSGISSIVTVTLFVSVVVTVIGVLNGFTETDSEKLLLMRTFGASKSQTFAKVVFPASLPTTVAVLKINVGMTWVGVIVGEFLTSKAGIGYLIVYGGQVFRMDLVMAGVLILCVLAGIMYYVVSATEKIISKKMAE